MYEGWHIELSRHAQRRFAERGIEESDILVTIANPDHVERQSAKGRLLGKYLPGHDRILEVAVEEYVAQSVLVVKTALWSKAS